NNIRSQQKKTIRYIAQENRFNFVLYMQKLFIYLIALLFFAGCHVEDKIDGYKSYEIVVVTLDVETTESIEKILLISGTNHRDSILKQEMGEDFSFKLKYPCRGESTFCVCVYTDSDTLCSVDDYAEGGYRPRLSFKNNTFKTISFH